MGIELSGMSTFSIACTLQVVQQGSMLHVNYLGCATVLLDRQSHKPRVEPLPLAISSRIK